MCVFLVLSTIGVVLVDYKDGVRGSHGIAHGQGCQSEVLREMDN